MHHPQMPQDAWMFLIILIPEALCPWLDNSHKLWLGRFMLDLQKISFSNRVVKLWVRSPERWEVSLKWVPMRILQIYPACNFCFGTSFLPIFYIHCLSGALLRVCLVERTSCLVWNAWSSPFVENRIFCLRFVAMRLRNINFFSFF